MKGIIEFIKKEAVLTAAVLLAVISAFFTVPDKEYIGYIDFRTLAILFCLMLVMAYFSKIGVFDFIARNLLRKVKASRNIILILVLLCFVFSMFITNDVALITFVPLTLIVLDKIGYDYQKKWLIPIVVMQTIAANLGSMLTPLGNPQNLYLYGKAEMGFLEFILYMLPYSFLALVGLIIWIVIGTIKDKGKLMITLSSKRMEFPRVKLIINIILFVICLLTVAKLIPYPITLAICVIVFAICDIKVFAAVDYSLLLTFVALFIFIGNMSRIVAFHDFIERIIENREALTAVISSQLISNVPAALLLSGFTGEYKKLLVGVNIGGLGTLIASMASLISYKYVARKDGKLRLPYLGYFTIANIIFLILELILMCLVT